MPASLMFAVFVVILVTLFFFFNDTATTEIYTLSLHDALPISLPGADRDAPRGDGAPGSAPRAAHPGKDRKSTRLNSSHGYISYAVFCLKKKKDGHIPEWGLPRLRCTLTGLNTATAIRSLSFSR